MRLIDRNIQKDEESFELTAVIRVSGVEAHRLQARNPETVAHLFMTAGTLDPISIECGAFIKEPWFMVSELAGTATVRQSGGMDW